MSMKNQFCTRVNFFFPSLCVSKEAEMKYSPSPCGDIHKMKKNSKEMIRPKGILTEALKTFIKVLASPEDLSDYRLKCSYEEKVGIGNRNNRFALSTSQKGRQCSVSGENLHAYNGKHLSVYISPKLSPKQREFSEYYIWAYNLYACTLEKNQNMDTRLCVCDSKQTLEHGGGYSIVIDKGEDSCIVGKSSDLLSEWSGSHPNCWTMEPYLRDFPVIVSYRRLEEKVAQIMRSESLSKSSRKVRLCRLYNTFGITFEPNTLFLRINPCSILYESDSNSKSSISDKFYTDTTNVHYFAFIKIHLSEDLEKEKKTVFWHKYVSNHYPTPYSTPDLDTKRIKHIMISEKLKFNLLVDEFCEKGSKYIYIELCRYGDVITF